MVGPAGADAAAFEAEAALGRRDAARVIVPEPALAAEIIVPEPALGAEIVAQLPLRGLEGERPALDPVLPPQCLLLLPQNMLRPLGALHPRGALRLARVAARLADGRRAALRTEGLRLAPLDPNRRNAALGARLAALDPDQCASLLRPRRAALDARRGAAKLDIALRPAALHRRRSPRLALGAALLLALGPLLLRRL